MEFWSIRGQSDFTARPLRYSITPLFGTRERFVKPRLATLRGVPMNDPAFGRFVDC